MNNEDIFITFLKDKNKYNEYKHLLEVFYFAHAEEDRLADDKVRIKNVLFISINWYYSTEGYEYWKNLHTEWKKLCDFFSLKGYIDLTKV